MDADIPQVLAACADFDRILKSFVRCQKFRPGAGVSGPEQGEAVQQAFKLLEGVGFFKSLLEEESRICNVVVPSSPVERCSHGRVADSLVPGIFPNTLEVQQLLQQLDTVNGTIRALDEMIAAENIPLTDLGNSFAPISGEVPAASNTLPGHIPNSATLPGQPVIEGGNNNLRGEGSALVSRDNVPSRRLADAEDTADVASLLCSPDSPPPLQDMVPAVSPKPPDSQQLFQVVPVDVLKAESAPSAGPVLSMALPKGKKSKKHVADETSKSENGAPKSEQDFGEKTAVPLEDVIESFSEDLVVRSQDAIQATWEEIQVELPDKSADFGLQEQAMVAVESTVYGPYGKVIDVTDEHLEHLEPEATTTSMALVPYAPTVKRVKPPTVKPKLTDALGRPLRRRRPAQLSQQLQRFSQLHCGPASQTASQRLCASLARKRRQSQRHWVLSQGKNGKRSSEAKAVDSKVASRTTGTPERPNVLFTGFSRSDLHQLKQSVNCLGGSAVRDLPAGPTAAETRVVVRCTSSDEGWIAGARTIKYLEAVLAGAWVLSAEWVKESMRLGHWLAEAKFELQGDTAQMGGPPRGRHHGPTLFSKLRFHFVPQVRKHKDSTEEAEGPAPNELARLARRAGAEVLETLRKLPDAKEDPPHLSDDLLSRKRKRSSGKESLSLPNLWWRKPIMVTVPSKASATKGRGFERTVRLADELGWVTLPSSWMLDCISLGEVCLPRDMKDC